MHTIIVVAVGLGLLGLCAVVGHVVGGAAGLARASIIFLPLWFVAAAINLYVGVKRAGYSVKDEMPIFLLVFAVPAAVGLLIWWKLR
jgi:hypothetical protein